MSSYRLTLEQYEKIKNATNYPMKINDGCKGCNRYWYGCEPDNCQPAQYNKEGQCSRCNRCLACCGDIGVKYSCAWKFAQKSPEQKRRSYAAYERWENHLNILGHNRRIT